MAKIIGNTTATPTPVSDWLQTDPAKADYIKNKPEIDDSLSVESENLVKNKVITKALEEISARIGDESVSDQISQAVSQSAPRVATVTMPAASWAGADALWSQGVVINGTTAYSKVDLYPSASQIIELQSDGISFMIQNEDGTTTAWAIGGQPTKDYEIQALITEVVVA